MNEISHLQARFLIRQGMDIPLPEEQWAALQAHLERCAECRVYQDSLLELEKELHHRLLVRWARAQTPTQDLPAQVMDFRSQRAQWRRLALRGLLGLFTLLALLLAGWSARESFNPRARRPALSPIPARTPTPLPPERFRGVVVFQSKPVDNYEISLLNPGNSQSTTELTNLTQSPAEDTDPAWSPDGAWIAFLSNRTGKREVYVISVAGTRLTQLTSDPQVDWQGPLTWSTDGKQLALIGLLGSRVGSPWVYLVPLSGAGAEVVPGTRGASGPVRFAPGAKGNVFLVYTSSDFGGSILRYDQDSGQVKNLTLDDNTARGYETGINGAYNYFETGNLEVILYLAEVKGTPSPGGSVFDVEGSRQIRLSSYSRVLDRTDTFTMLRGAVGGIRSMTSTLTDNRFLYLQDNGEPGCWRLHQYYQDSVEPRTRMLSDLCVDGELDRSQWSPDGRWTVLIARRPEDSKPALYAVRLPDVNHPNGPELVQKLADAAGITGLVQVRPDGRGRGIQPTSVLPVK